MSQLEQFRIKRRATKVQRKTSFSPDMDNEQPSHVAQAVSQPSAQSLTPDVVRSLQRSHGNQFVQRLVSKSKQPTVQRTPIHTSTAPTRIQRLAYTDSPSSWGDVTVTRSGEGIEGVYFIKKDGATIVVKPTNNPTSMDYANQVMESVGLEAPKLSAYAKTSTEGDVITQLLLLNKGIGRTVKNTEGKEVNQVEKQLSENSYFVVMNTVQGDSIQRLDDDTEEQFLKNDAALQNVGRLMVADSFIGNGDRLVSAVNLGNFFYQAANGDTDMGNIATIDNEVSFDETKLDARASTISSLFNKASREGFLQGVVVKLKANAAKKPKSLALLDTMKKMQTIMDKISVGVDQGFKDLAAKFAGTMDIVRRDLKDTNTKHGTKVSVDMAKALGLFIVALVNGTDAKTARKNLTNYMAYRNRRGKLATGFKWLAKLGGRGF